MTNKENTGAIFKNTYKTENDKQPDYKGGINVDGKEKDIALWLREKDGKKYFSVSISEPYKKPETAHDDEAINTDLPF